MDATARKKALRMVPYGLYLLGARRKEPQSEEDLHATVVSWVAQCSFEPPMLVVGLKRGSRAHELVRESGVFALNMLGDDQKDAAVTFFKAVTHEGRTMNGLEYARGDATGCPVFLATPAHVECEVVRLVEEENDHAVALAKVVAAGHRRDAAPLTTKGTGWSYAG